MSLNNNRKRVSFMLTLMTVLLLLGSAVMAQTGVSDDRVSLPEGPGSLEGIGENVGMQAHMGNMSYNIPIQVPNGFSGATPSLELTYNSGAGNNTAGIGWLMDVPYIERMTYRGLPQYQSDDDFAFAGFQQLVRTEDNGTDAVYRARFEKGFVRYTWKQHGAEGYWLAEYPDGSIGYFGADRSGRRVDEARVSGDDGTFRYMLVEKVDVFDHVLRYDYIKDGHIALVNAISYVFKDDGPRYQVTFEYQERSDVTGFDYLSDAKAGFDERLTQRLSVINVFSSSERIRRYELGYEPYSVSGGFTRLSQVQMYGHDGSPYPITQSFSYSRALDGACNQGQACDRPLVRSMGSVGVGLGSGQVTLMDINGDALPDVLYTPVDGNHQFFMNVPDPDGNARFNTTPVVSQLGNSGTRLGNRTHVLDVDGDGFTDLLNAQTGRYLKNKGGGDWSAVISIADTSALPVGDGAELSAARFMDYDNDKKIDIIRAQRDDTTIYRNLGSAGFVVDNDAEQIGRGFREHELDLADMNGDGLLDIVQLQPGKVVYKLNFGWGKWSDWREIRDVSMLTDVAYQQARLEDINGDALADLVRVSARTVQYAINRNGERFLETRELTGRDVDHSQAEIPTLDNNTHVLFADMNGNGSSDVVWIDGGGMVTYLELFPVRPNLLARIENGIGMIQEIDYATSVQNMARDHALGRTWLHKLPHPMIVVDRIDIYDLLTNVHDETFYRYHDGFYDGIEKRFRGYGQVEALMPEALDGSQEKGQRTSWFHVGAEDPYYHGLLERETTINISDADASKILTEITNSYDECGLDAIPPQNQLDLPIKHICQKATETITKEGVETSEHITTRREMAYDGYGNVTLQSDLGVVAIGGGRCKPCERSRELFGEPCDQGGDRCVGDEFFVETAYIAPGRDTGGRWITGAPWRIREFGQQGSDQFKETLHYYDGPDFVGLPQGQLTQGQAVRTTRKIQASSDATIDQARNAYNAHGNVIETIDPNGAPGLHTHHRRYTYGEDNLRVTQVDILLEDPAGKPYVLRKSIRYERLFDKPVEATDWMRVEGGQAVSSPRSSFFVYDTFGRIISLIKPGDSPATPTQVYTYELGNPSSQIRVQSRSKAGGALDLEAVRCLDGRGRAYQTRTLLSQSPLKYQVTGFKVFNERSAPVRVYQPYISASSVCDERPPTDVRFTQYRYDSTYRPLEVHVPDGDLYDGRSVERTRYAPLTTLSYDSEDTDETSPHYNTPVVKRMDGLGRLVSLKRHLTSDRAEGLELQYDALGRLQGYIDAEGNIKTQHYDLLDRVTRLKDPNSSGDSTFTYDAVGNIIQGTDGRNITTITNYDGLNRPIARWDEADPEGTMIRWSYDAAPGCDRTECINPEGRLAQVTYPLTGLEGDQQGIERFGYDVRGRRVRTAKTLEGYTFIKWMEYDNADRHISTTYPDGRVIEREYDDASRLTSIDGIVHTISYDDRSLLKSMGCADGSSTTYHHDGLMRLAQAQTTDSRGAMLQGFAYHRSRTGNLLAVNDLSDAAIPSPSASAAYSYDAWYRLIEARLGTTSDDQETLTYQYDVIDNTTARISSLGAASPVHLDSLDYSEHGPNAVSKAGDLSLDYDASGYTTQRGDTTLKWDFLGRMTRATRGGEAVGRFIYGHNQRRIMKIEGDSVTHYIDPDYEVRDGISTIYVRMGHKRLARLQSETMAAELLSDTAPASGPDGLIRASDAWMAHAAGEGIAQADSPSNPGRLLWSSMRRLLLEDGHETVYLHHDHLGSVTMATAGDGDVVGKRAFYLTGAERLGGFGYVEEYGFTGQEMDRSTGLIHFDFRYLDPVTGRWVSIDPLFQTAALSAIERFGESSTAYAYVANNTVNRFDPTGLASLGSVVGTLGGIMGAMGAFAAGVIGVVLGAPAAVGAAAGAALGAGIVGIVSGGVVLAGIGLYGAVKAAKSLSRRRKGAALRKVVKGLRTQKQNRQKAEKMQAKAAATAFLNRPHPPSPASSQSSYSTATENSYHSALSSPSSTPSSSPTVSRSSSRSSVQAGDSKSSGGSKK